MKDTASPLPVQPLIDAPKPEYDKTEPAYAPIQNGKTHLRVYKRIVLLLIFFAVITVLMKRNIPPKSEPAPQIYSSPTLDMRQKQTSFIASQSAFLMAVDAIATLSAHLDSTQITEPRLAPPELTLPLGFSK